MRTHAGFILLVTLNVCLASCGGEGAVALRNTVAQAHPRIPVTILRSQEDSLRLPAEIAKGISEGHERGIIIRRGDTSSEISGASPGARNDAITSGCLTSGARTLIPDTSLFRWGGGTTYNAFMPMQTSACVGTAYFRDALVALRWFAQPVDDGDFWNVVLDIPDPNSPTPTRITFPTITFYRAYNGESDCFVVANGSPPVCFTQVLDVTFYTVSQCRPAGTWTFQVSDRDGFFDQRQVNVLERVPPSDVHIFNQSVPTPYDTWCHHPFETDPVTHKLVTLPCSDPLAVTWKWWDKACAMLAYVAASNDHGVFADPEAINLDSSYFQGDGFFNPHRLAEVSGRRLAVWSEVAGVPRSELRHYICRYGPPVARIPHDGTQHYVTVLGRTPSGDDFITGDPAYNAEMTMSAWGDGNYSSIRIFSGLATQIIVPPAAVSSGILSLSFFSPVDAVLTAPNGSKVGYDPRSAAEFSELPGSSYSRSQLDFHGFEATDDNNDVKSLQVSDPEGGSYVLEVIGTRSGTYRFVAKSIDRYGVEINTTGTADVAIGAGEVHIYRFDYGPGQSIPTPQRIVSTAFSTFDVVRDRVQERTSLTSFFFAANFALAGDSDGVSVMTEPVSLTLLDGAGEVYSETIPPGSFAPLKNGTGFKYRGEAGNIVGMQINNDGTLKVTARRLGARQVDETTLRLRVNIGNDFGEAAVP